MINLLKPVQIISILTNKVSSLKLAMSEVVSRRNINS